MCHAACTATSCAHSIRAVRTATGAPACTATMCCPEILPRPWPLVKPGRDPGGPGRAGHGGGGDCTHPDTTTAGSGPGSVGGTMAGTGSSDCRMCLLVYRAARSLPLSDQADRFPLPSGGVAFPARMRRQLLRALVIVGPFLHPHGGPPVGIGGSGHGRSAARVHCRAGEENAWLFG